MHSSRPLPGVLISLQSVPVHWKPHIVLVPFPGFLYLYFLKFYWHSETGIVLVPFPGFLYLYRSTYVPRHLVFSSRPLPGVLISLQTWILQYMRDMRFSSPSRGSYISTTVTKHYIMMFSSRPLPGVLISLQDMILLEMSFSSFSSPSRGSYISTTQMNTF